MNRLKRSLSAWLGLFVVLLLLPSLSQAVIPQHLDYGCSICHYWHGGEPGTTLLAALDTESLCLSCHGEASAVATVVTVHNPLGLNASDQGYITCRECHDAHEYVGTPNKRMIGYEYDPETNLRPASPPAIRVENTTTSLASPVYRTVTFAKDSKEPTPDFNIDGTFPGPGACQVCHDPNHNVGQDCTTCHPHDGGFLPSGGSCIACHDGTDVTAPVVTYNSAHSKNTLFAVTAPTSFDCVSCHSGHGAGTIEIPNYNAVGINYSLNGELGISLGSATVTGNTEAEICWNCHNDYGVSEWGENSDTNGPGFPNYNTGSLSGSIAPAWVNATGTTGASWSSATFSYKQGDIQSTHSVNETSGLSGLDATTNIRCSYCHDVHDLNVLTTDLSSGKPYLRGSWVSSPYNEDGAPRNDASPSLPGDVADYLAYDVGGKFGAVPRGGTTYTATGGYFIDQNSGSPTADTLMDSPDEFAGLCVLCHENGNGDGSWSGSEIAAINKFGNPADDWVGNSNSHAAVVKGGNGVGAVNIFTMARRFPTTPWAAYTGNGSHRGNPVMAYRNAREYNKGTWRTNYWAEGLRGIDSVAFGFSPRVDTVTRQYNYGNYNWGATVVSENGDGSMTDSGVDAGFHQFTCSKCHNPHASRLPRLLVTNCLDTNHNTWDDTLTTSNDAALSAENQSIPFSQSTSAQNCHRLADSNYPQAGPQGTTTGGWNRVTPWTEF